LFLFRFERDQVVANVGGVKLGGQPGEHPTALCGTIFYQGQRLVQDEDRGLFDRERAEALVSRQAELSQETGNPSILHIFARTAQAFERYLEFAEGCWGGPMIIDSADATIRSAMAGLVSELGLADLAVYNSLSLATGEEEVSALQEAEIDSAIILAYNPAVPGVDGSLAVLETGGTVRDRGLITLAKDLGMKNLLGSGAGAALRFSVVAKARLGLPVGSGIHNAVSAWDWLKRHEKQTRNCCDAAAAAMQLLSAGDFLLYGPIENADFIFPVAAMSDILVAEAVRDLEVWPVPEHPIFRLA
jgi:tetrahydromethanopterin S-methyltransferase subunit H